MKVGTNALSYNPFLITLATGVPSTQATGAILYDPDSADDIDDDDPDEDLDI